MTMLVSLQFRGQQDNSFRHILVVVAFASFAASCAAPPPAMRVPVEPGMRLTRDHVLEYQLPVGWFDATADTQAVGHAAWLLKNDYAASITIDRITLDDAARETIGKNDLLRLTELVMSLMASNRPASIVKKPLMETVGGSPYCFFELQTMEEETLRVAVLDTGERTYTVTLYQARGEGSAEEREAFLREFLGMLRR